MGDSNNLAGAGLTVALPLAVFAVVILWGFFERKASRTFGGVSKSATLEVAGRPNIDRETDEPEA
jgi:hypothetical protein